MSVDLKWTAYRNVCKMLEYRGYTLGSPALTEAEYLAGPRIREIVTDKLTVLFVPDEKSDLYAKSNLESVTATGRHMVVNLGLKKTAKRGPNVLHVSHFYVDWPAHVTTSPHRIVPPAEYEPLLAHLRIDKTRLPKIALRTTACAWLGAVPGDVIANEQDSESASINGETYRLVIE